MIPVKIQCACGQRYAFDVEPVNGRLTSPVACPVCGLDGTAAANAAVAQALAAQPPPAPPPLPRASSPAAPRPGLPRPSPPPARRGKDGWAAEETQINKLGTWIMVTPAILGSLLTWGLFGFKAPILLLCFIIGVAGAAGGALNVAGRGPLLAGAVVGLLIALGGYSAVCWWIHDRKSAYTLELLVAFAIGAAPGFILQFVIQRILRKRARST